jgi:hypothetical protein
MKRAIISCAMLALVAIVAVAGEFDDWKYDGSFHKLIDKADRIVIRNGGYNCCGPVDKDKIILTLTKRTDITNFNAVIQFETNQTWDACMCCGYPGVDWYIGKKRIALTGVQHGIGLRWKGFPGDASFTKESSQRFAQWVLDHGIPDLHEQFKKIAEKEKLPTTKSTLSSEGAPSDER